MAEPSPTGRRSVVLLAHALPPEEHTGVTLTASGYARDLAGRGWDVTVVHGSDQPDPGWELGCPARHQRPDEAFSRVPAPRTPWEGAQWARRAAASPADPGHSASDAAFLALLGDLRPALLHVVDNIDLPLSWPELAAATGVPVVRTVTCAEDLCGLIAPVSPCSGPGGHCAAPLTPAHCAGCVQAAMRDDPGPCAGPSEERPGAGDPARVRADRWRRDELVELLTVKRERARHQYRHVYSKAVFASPGFRAFFEETLPLDPERVAVVPMGIDPVEAPPAPPGPRPPGPVRFVMAATLHAAKGVAAVVDAFTSPEIAARADEWRLYMVGGGDRTLIEPLLGSPSVAHQGTFTPADLPGLFAGADVGISASVFETFHRVTREYLSAGLAVVGSTAFGITDAVVDGENGLLFDHAEPGSLGRAVLRLLDDPDQLERLRTGARATRIRTVADEVDDLEALYRHLATDLR